MKLIFLIVTSMLVSTWAKRHSRNVLPPEGQQFNHQPFAPPHVKAHVFIYANGSVDIFDGPNPFANNALDGLQFLEEEMKFSVQQIEEKRQEAIAFWKEEFGVDGNALEGDGVVLAYQISPNVNERAFIVTNPCPVPSEGYPVTDGGFHLFITNPVGHSVIDPKTNQTKILPFQTNLVYSWLRIDTRSGRRTRQCRENMYEGGPRKPPATIIIPYRTLRPTLWTLDSVMFDLSIGRGNYFGEGICIGQSAPIVDRENGKILNRLSDYITFHGDFVRTHQTKIRV